MDGLTDQEVILQQEKYGYNTLPERKALSFFQIFLEQFKSPLLLVLLAVSIISLVFSEKEDSILIFIVMILNALMGTFQEHSAEKTLNALHNIVTQDTTVIRNGKRVKVDTTGLVPEDLVVMGAGDRIPADGVVIEEINLQVEEAALTGESRPIKKEVDQTVFMGTSVAAGKGIFKVTKIGVETEIGKIGKSLKEVKQEETPLQAELERFSKKLSFIVIAICVAIFIIKLLHGESLWEAFRISIILSIAAIPEGLPIAVTVILSLGIKRILKQKGLVKKLLSVETLGSTTVICTDKTGTLTEGKMRVVETEFKDQKKAELIMTLCNEQRTPMEIALWDFVNKENLKDDLEYWNKLKPIHDVPFNSENKYTVTAYSENGTSHTFLMGAPDIVINFTNLKEDEKVARKEQFISMAKSGLRLIAFAYKKDGDVKELKDFEWIGLAGIEDPLRETAKASLDEAIKAGIQVKIVTGDYLETALSIANSLGLDVTEENSLTSIEIDKLSDDELAGKIENTKLFARVTPLQKLRIVEALQKNGEVVAMTGDGVNDAPALKKADIGIVMGNGTDTAKEAGDLILLDNNFETIVHCIKEGRLIYANIQKVISYILSNSFAEIILILGATLMRLPNPLTVLQILWIHIICDGPLDIVLSFEQRRDKRMEITPTNSRNNPIFGVKTLFTVIMISLTAGTMALYLFNHFYKGEGQAILANSIAFATLGAIDIIYIYAFKDLTKPIWKMKNPFDNKALNITVIASWIFLLLPFFIKPIGNFLKIERLSLANWVEVIAIGLITTAIVEMIKGVKRR